jgi:hypothetical protein
MILVQTAITQAFEKSTVELVLTFSQGLYGTRCLIN